MSKNDEVTPEKFIEDLTNSTELALASLLPDVSAQDPRERFLAILERAGIHTQSEPSSIRSLQHDSALRVVLADSSTLIRGAIARVLQDDGMQVVGEVGDATALLRVVDQHQPDIAVIEIRMPPSNTVDGIETAMTIRANHPRTAVLLLSQYVETDAAMKLLEGGAAGVGYLIKDRISGIDEFIWAVNTVAAGGTVIDSILVDRMMDRAHRGHKPLDELTDREREVLALIAEGKTNQAIGAELFLSRRTVERHISAIFNKLGLQPEPDDHRRGSAILIYLKATTS